MRRIARSNDRGFNWVNVVGQFRMLLRGVKEVKSEWDAETTCDRSYEPQCNDNRIVENFESGLCSLSMSLTPRDRSRVTAESEHLFGIAQERCSQKI